MYYKPWIFARNIPYLMGESRNVYIILIGKTELEIPLEKPRRKWDDNIKMDHKEVECNYVDWTDVA
jgi:hypothetical protein